MNETWLTPRDIIDELGPFDMDPCCPPTMPWQTAKTMIHMPDNGLSKVWEGRVWLNPPYNRFCWDHWIPKMAEHNNGIALLIPRSDKWQFHRYIMERAEAIFFFKDRVRFCDQDGVEMRQGLPWPSMLVAYGRQNAEALLRLSRSGSIAYPGDSSSR